jgi:putative two-component system hydrogenase maturation factor HypX/HoxX
MEAAAARHRPELIVCPMLKTIIPESVWRAHRCLVVHPGPAGDRGPSSLDWAIELGHAEWGVTLLEATGEVDGGPVWATRTFPTRPAAKTSLYRHEVRRAAVSAVVEAVGRIAAGETAPPPAATAPTGRERPPMQQSQRAIDWSADGMATVLRRIRAAEGHPGVLDAIGGTEFHLFGAHPERAMRGRPGDVIARRHGAICRATVDGAVWITHLKPAREGGFKLPAVSALAAAGSAPDVPEVPVAIDAPLPPDHTWREIAYEERAGVGYLHFDFHNGAMSTDQARRLREAYLHARGRSQTNVIVLMGGTEFFSNGIHLNVIEAAADPAEESWFNLHAIDDVVREVVETPSHLVIAALCGDAAAGGVPFALAADQVVAREDVVLNPYYQHMGGLYGSEYWTYLMPRRVGDEAAQRLTRTFAPVGAREAVALGLLDSAFGEDIASFHAQVRGLAERLARHPAVGHWLEEKRRRRALDEQARPLEAYRAEELRRSHECFFGADRSYHEARSRFVHKLGAPCAVTPAPRPAVAQPVRAAA